MKIFIALCLVAVSLAYDDVLSQVLKSPKATLQLYTDFKSKQQLQYLNTEMRIVTSMASIPEETFWRNEEPNILVAKHRGKII